MLAFVDVPRPRGERDSQQPAVAELVRVSYPPGAPPQEDLDSFRRRGEVVGRTEGNPLQPGMRVRIFDAEIGSRAGDRAGWTMRYAVRVRDRRGRSSPLVVSLDLPVGPEIPPPVSLRGTATAEGVRLVWDAAPADAGVENLRYNVYRTNDGGEFGESPRNGAPLGGLEFLDASVDAGSTYVYTVRTVGSEGLPFRESVSSETARVTAEDRFAPAPPAGLVVVQEGGGVRLFWDPGAERDLDRYRIYRRVDGGEWGLAPGGEAEQPTWIDRDVRPGDRLEYRVTALDRADPPNESEPSEPGAVLVAEDPDSWQEDRR